MKRFLIVLIFLVFFALGFLGFATAIYNEINNFEFPSFDFLTTNPEDDESENQIDTSNLEEKYFEDVELGVKIIVTKKIPQLIINDDKEKFAKDVLEEANSNLGINGGYFLPDWSHAGLLEINGEIIVREALNDKQVTGLVLIHENRISIEKVEEIYNVNAPTVFQTGPIIILGNEVQNDAINLAPNGSGEFIRSFIGTTSDNEIIIGVSTKFITLNDLAESLLKNEYLKQKEIDVINLDGGSSTVLYSKENPKFQINTFKKIPFILGF